jgi:hypothetical protein
MIEEIKIEKDKTPKTTPNKPILDVDHKNGKKKYYKPKKKREILNIEIGKIGLDNFHKVVHTEKPYLEYKKLITNKNVGSDFIDNSKKFSFIKSGIRIVACICGLFGEFELAFILLGVAEIFDVYK